MISGSKGSILQYTQTFKINIHFYYVLLKGTILHNLKDNILYNNINNYKKNINTQHKLL